MSEINEIPTPPPEPPEPPENKFSSGLEMSSLKIDNDIKTNYSGEWIGDSETDVQVNDEVKKEITTDLEMNTENILSDVPEINEYNSTYKERIGTTPAAKDIDDDGFYGYWDGKRGESTFTLTDSIPYEGSEGLNTMNSVEYKDGIPDFSPYAEDTVKIDNMTENRTGKDGNYEQCDTACAEKWNSEGKDGKDDWTARDVENWRDAHEYSWHERNDMKTCDLIPTEINDSFGHLGGVGECKRRID
jgi:hypothetical protein